MNDPHVTALIYRVDHSDAVDYSKAEALDREELGFHLIVKGKEARFELKDHYATEEGAQGAVAEYIHAWKFDACLHFNTGLITSD